MSADFPKHWNLLTLEDAVEAIIDYRGKTPKKTTFGIPLITAKIVKNGRIETPTEFIAHEDYASWMVRGFPSVGDVVITTEAPLGEVAQITNAKVALAQRIVTLRGKKGILNNDYLLCVMQSKFVQDQLEARSSGSTVRGIKQSELRKVLLPIPPEIEQIQIANQVLALSKKIDLNTQTNQTLESIAQAIFKSWFVDFEPVKAKMAVLAEGGTREQAELAAMGAISGKSEAELAQLQQQNPEHYQQLAETAALFPSAMVESELGEIPEGWEVKYLKELTTDIKRGISPKYSEEFGTLVINQKCIRNHKIDFSLCRLNDSEKKSIKGRELKVGDVLINSTGVGTLGRLSPIRHLPEPCTFDSHVTLARPDETLITPQFLAGFLIENETFIESSGAGSTGQTELNRQVIEELKLAYPDKTIISCFENIAKPISEKIAFCENEIKTLAQLRDSLLPKLLSGEIDLSDIQSEVA